MSHATPRLATWLPSARAGLCRHDLAIALRFVDPFVDIAPPVPPFRRAAIPDALVVRIESLEWAPHFEPSDGTYRFSVSNASLDVPWHAAVMFGTAQPPQFPAVPVDLSVSVEREDQRRARYFVPSPIEVSLPVSGLTGTAPQRLAAYLREVEAYPTPLFRAPAGETCVRGVVRDSTGVVWAGVEVALYDGLALPPNAVFTRTNEDGAFAYRLPWLKRRSPVPAAPSLGIMVRPVGGAPFAVQSDPHPAGDPTRASFAYGLTTSVAIEAS